MKTIIAGSRASWITFNHVVKAMRAAREAGIDPTLIVSGTAVGVDRLGKDWAQWHQLPVKRFPAKWKVGGKIDRAAGIKRNEKMAKFAEALVAVWDGKSPGTKHMIEAAKKRGLKIYVHKI